MTNSWLNVTSAAADAHRAELHRQAARHRLAPRPEPLHLRLRRVLGHLHSGPPNRPSR